MESDFKQSLDTVKYIYSTFPISLEDVHVALGIISSSPEIIFSFDKYFDKQSLDMSISTVEFPGTSQNSNIGQSLTLVKEMLYSSSSRKAVRQILVILVHGESNDSLSDPVRRLRDSGVEIFCLGAGKKINVSELAEIASTPTENHVVMDNIVDLPRGARDLVDKLQIAKVQQGTLSNERKRLLKNILFMIIIMFHCVDKDDWVLWVNYQLCRTTEN